MKTTNKIVAYYRTSTKSQALGLKAQQDVVQRYAQENNLNIIEEIEEQETGKEDERPGILKAMALARKHKATLVAFRVDRISRDLSFAAKVFFKSGINVCALDLPFDPSDATTFAIMFSCKAGTAQAELKVKSIRQKGANAEIKKIIERDGFYISKKSGREITKLGSPVAQFTPEMREKAAKERKETADRNTANLAASAELKKFFASQTGKRNLSAAARHLNDMQLYTPRGVFHDAKSVKLLCQRYDI